MAYNNVITKAAITEAKLDDNGVIELLRRSKAVGGHFYGRRAYKTVIKPALRNAGFRHDPASVVLKDDGEKWASSRWVNDAGESFTIHYSQPTGNVNANGFELKANIIK